jgi:hypothetical protein
MAISPQDVFEYHRRGRPGKIEVTPTKPLSTQRELSLAYSPGVAEAVLEIASRPLPAYELTAKANLVAVISNGTAILGLGNKGPLAAKPVMEGKGVRIAPPPRKTRFRLLVRLYRAAFPPARLLRKVSRSYPYISILLSQALLGAMGVTTARHAHTDHSGNTVVSENTDTVDL